MNTEKPILYAEESYKIIGACMEMHKHFGKGGFSEIVIKNAIQYEFALKNIPYAREVGYDVEYKGILLPHKFF